MNPTQKQQMIFDLETKSLYTDDGTVIKKLECPFRKNWGSLKPTVDDRRKHCNSCDRMVIDTQYYLEEELVRMVKQDSGTCFKVNLLQENITIR